MKLTDTKIMLVGESKYGMYSKAFYDAWKKLGYSNIEYFTTDEFTENKRTKLKPVEIYHRIENNLVFGLDIFRLNKELIKRVNTFLPQLVFIYNSRYIFKSTLEKIKMRNAKVFLYSNDNPFSDFFPKYFWRHFVRGLSVADVGFVYRMCNIKDFQNAGCKNIQMLRSYYIEERNHVERNDTLDIPKVVFLGHYEDDGRKDYINALLDCGIEVGITKQGWEKLENKKLFKLENAHEMYNQILNQAEIAIVFLSKINGDTYTRRCFEIPATKTMMVAPYTDELALLFTENKEAVYYRSKEEFVKKITYYLEHEDERQSIAEAGYERLKQDGHEVKDRVRYIMKIYEQIMER